MPLASIYDSPALVEEGPIGPLHHRVEDLRPQIEVALIRPIGAVEEGEEMDGPAGCARRIQGVVGDYFEFISLEFRLKEAVEWAVKTVLWLAGKIAAALGREQKEPVELPEAPQPSPPPFCVPSPKRVRPIHDPVAKARYADLVKQVVEPILRGSRRRLDRPNQELVRLISEIAAQKLCDVRDAPPQAKGGSEMAQTMRRHPELVTSWFKYLEAVGGPEEFAEQISRLSERLLERLDTTEVKRIREGLFSEGASYIRAMIGAVRAIDPDLEGGKEDRILRELKLCPATRLRGDPRARRAFEVEYLRARFHEMLTGALTSADETEQLLYHAVIPFLSDMLARSTSQGLDKLGEKEQVDTVFYHVLRAIDPEGFHVPGGPEHNRAKPGRARPMSRSEIDAVLSVVQVFLDDVCDLEGAYDIAGSVLVRGVVTDRKLQQGFSILFTRKGYLNPAPLLDPLRRIAGEGDPHPEALPGAQRGKVQEFFASDRNLPGPAAMLKPGLDWTRRLVLTYPGLLRNGSLLVIDRAVTDVSRRKVE